MPLFTLSVSTQPSEHVVYPPEPTYLLLHTYLRRWCLYHALTVCVTPLQSNMPPSPPTHPRSSISFLLILLWCNRAAAGGRVTSAKNVLSKPMWWEVTHERVSARENSFADRISWAVGSTVVAVEMVREMPPPRCPPACVCTYLPTETRDKSSAQAIQVREALLVHSSSRTSDKFRMHAVLSLDQLTLKADCLPL